MRNIHKTLVPGLEVEFHISDELVREYRECAADTDCKSCGWNNARIGRQCICGLSELEELGNPPEELTGWRAQMMRVFLGGNASGQADPVPVHRCL